jgi:hypothetical protein
MKHHSSFRRAIFFILILCVMLGLMACAVLTSSQVSEVKNFVQASEAYTELPGALVQSYGILLRDNELLKVSRYEFGKRGVGGAIDTAQANTAWNDIKKAYELEEELSVAGKRMDGALAVLKTYSNILSVLVSDEYTKALGEITVKLGKSLDNSIESYNKKYRADNPLEKIGGLVGQVVRSAGGIYIRHRQYIILRDTLQAADPLIKNLMAEVKDIASNQMKPAIENYEKNYLSKEFKSVANNSGRLSVTVVMFVYEDLRRTRQAALLSDQVAKAADTYALAHEKLVGKTRKRQDLDQVIDELQALRKEVEEANKVKKNIEKG